MRSLALDEGSRTSAALARVLLAERFGIRPALRTLPVGPATGPAAGRDAAADSVAQTDADAVLLIGDRAMTDPPDRRTGRPFAAVWDLGEVWNDWTGLPFVFAVWASRPGLDATCGDDLAQQFAASRDAGVSDLAALAAAGGPPLGLSAADAEDYLRRNLHFSLGPAERAGLALFCELCVRNDLLPTGTRPVYAPATLRRSLVRLVDSPPSAARSAVPDPLHVT